MAELFEMRDGSTVTDPRLGRLRSFDERSRNFAISPIGLAAIKTAIWDVPPVLNQGDDGTCVGHGNEAEAGATPVPVRPCTHEDALTWFDMAAAIDEWPNTTSRADGTSVLAGAKVGVKRGFYTSYRWCFSKADVYTALQEGPVVVGTDWLEGMFAPDSFGQIIPEGDVAGGHCYLIYGLVLAGDINPLTGQTAGEDIYLIQNSWGRNWGIGGRVWMYTSNFEKLRLAGGEVMVPTGRKDPYEQPQPKPKPQWRWHWDRFRGWIRILVRSVSTEKRHAA